jgi:hypothetical protein
MNLTRIGRISSLPAPMLLFFPAVQMPSLPAISIVEKECGLPVFRLPSAISNAETAGTEGCGSEGRVISGKF